MTHGATVRQGAGPGEYSLEGTLDLEAALRLSREPLEGEFLRIDLGALQGFTGSGAAYLLDLIRRFGPHIRFTRVPADLVEYLRELPTPELVSAQPLDEALEEQPFIETAGSGWIEFVRSARFFLALALEFLYWAVLAPLRGQRLRLGRWITEVNRVGIDAIPIVGLISLLIGIILALNAASQLVNYGAEKFTADLVSIALARELSPVITAVLVAGRSGSAITAEIATMVVTEEMDALRVMGINPRAFIVVPKLLALTAALPVLGVLSVLVGIGGGFGIAVWVLNLPFDLYWNATVHALEMTDILLGVLKSIVFGALIGLTAATLGLRVTGGSSGVGKVTTTAVVTAFFLIIIFNTFFTYLFFALDF